MSESNPNGGVEGSEAEMGGGVNETGEKDLNPGKPREMPVTQINGAIEAVMKPEGSPMSAEAGPNKTGNVESAKGGGLRLVEAFKENPTIGKIVNSPLFVPAICITVAIISNQISESAHSQGEAILNAVGNPFFDDMSTRLDLRSWEDYMYFRPEVVKDALLFRGGQLLSVAAAGVGILKLGSSALEWVKQKTKGEQEQGGDSATLEAPQPGYPEWNK